jgi:hypothetical protein
MTSPFVVPPTTNIRQPVEGPPSIKAERERLRKEVNRARHIVLDRARAEKNKDRVPIRPPPSIKAQRKMRHDLAVQARRDERKSSDIVGRELVF